MVFSKNSVTCNQNPKRFFLSTSKVGKKRVSYRQKNMVGKHANESLIIYVNAAGHVFQNPLFCDTLLFNFHLINLLDQLHKASAANFDWKTQKQNCRSSCPEDHPYNYCDITDESWEIERKKRRTNDKWYNVKKVAKKDDIKLKRLSSGFSYFHGVKTSLFDSKNSFKTVIFRT